MQLDKDLENHIIFNYEKWLHYYLNVDVKTYDSILDVVYHFKGSATKEAFLNRKDRTEFFADTGGQFAGNTEIRNELIAIEEFRELNTSILDVCFLNDEEWNFYSRFQFSSVLKKTKDGWCLIYQNFPFQKNNANGIPKNSIDDIFQYFFTPSPPGRGTGLGLRLGYDIITKSYQGQLTVESKQMRVINFQSNYLLI